MPALQFDHIHNRDSGKSGFVLGLGASLRRHLDFLRLIQQDKQHHKIISCNNADMMTDIDFDYWMLAQPADSDNPLCIKNAWQRYNSRSDRMLLYTDCLDLTPRAWVAEHLKIDYIGYDQRHWNSEPCTWGRLPGGRAECCSRIIEGRLSIQEYFQKITNMPRHYGAGDTVGVHMVALAVILGLNPIWVLGIDLDYTKGYVNNDLPFSAARTNMGMSNVNNNPPIVPRVLSDLSIIRNSAHNVGINIYCADSDLKISTIFDYRPLT